MACFVCGDSGSGDPSVGIYEDDGVCPSCAAEGYRDECDSGCYSDPSGELHVCERHDPTSVSRLWTWEQYRAAVGDPRR